MQFGILGRTSYREDCEQAPALQSQADEVFFERFQCGVVTVVDAGDNVEADAGFVGQDFHRFCGPLETVGRAPHPVVFLLKAIEADGDGVEACLEEFIDYVTANFDCYWLTTHCKGDAVTAQRYLAEFFPVEVIKKLQCIKPTTWDPLKTEAINLKEEFYWLDDYPLTQSWMC